MSKNFDFHKLHVSLHFEANGSFNLQTSGFPFTVPSYGFRAPLGERGALKAEAGQATTTAAKL
jgi:hypothetical protein